MAEKQEKSGVWGCAAASIPAAIAAIATITVAIIQLMPKGSEPKPVTPETTSRSLAAPAPIPVQRPSAIIQNVWIEHNVPVGAELGLRLHAQFTLNNAVGRSAFGTAYFSFADGTPLRDFNGLYTSLDGQASVGAPIVAQYPSAVFPDYVLVLPYSELHLDSGLHQLKARFQVSLIDSPETLALSLDVPFQVNWT